MQAKSKLLAMILTSAVAAPVSAATITYQGADDDVSSLADMANSQTAAAAFDTQFSGLQTADFETSPAFDVDGEFFRTTSRCSNNLCGFNTTPDGSRFISVFNGGAVTFTFADAINTLGFYVTGLQTEQLGPATVSFGESGIGMFDIPAANDGGGAFFGLSSDTAFDSFTYNGNRDITGIDDLRFGTAAAEVPEPASWAMFVLGALGIGGALRNRNRRHTAAASV